MVGKKRIDPESPSFSFSILLFALVKCSKQPLGKGREEESYVVAKFYV